jgi:hypothetical protein
VAVHEFRTTPSTLLDARRRGDGTAAREVSSFVVADRERGEREQFPRAGLLAKQRRLVLEDHEQREVRRVELVALGRAHPDVPARSIDIEFLTLVGRA